MGLLNRGPWLIRIMWVVVHFCSRANTDGSNLSVSFVEAPPTVSSSDRATFVFEVFVGGRENGCQGCSIKCKVGASLHIFFIFQSFCRRHFVWCHLHCHSAFFVGKKLEDMKIFNISRINFIFGTIACHFCSLITNNSQVVKPDKLPSGIYKMAAINLRSAWWVSKQMAVIATAGL